MAARECAAIGNRPSRSRSGWSRSECPRGVYQRAAHDLVVQHASASPSTRTRYFRAMFLASKPVKIPWTIPLRLTSCVGSPMSAVVFQNVALLRKSRIRLSSGDGNSRTFRENTSIPRYTPQRREGSAVGRPAVSTHIGDACLLTIAMAVKCTNSIDPVEPESPTLVTGC